MVLHCKLVILTKQALDVFNKFLLDIAPLLRLKISSQFLDDYDLEKIIPDWKYDWIK